MHVADWLRELDSVQLVAPVAVKIGHSTYHGASYFERPSRASQRSEPILYLLGNLPPSYKRSSHTCYRFPNEDRDWYVAGFADAAVAGAMPEFHPFGAWFQLRQWPHGFNEHLGQDWETIDHFNARPYKRVTIELVG